MLQKKDEQRSVELDQNLNSTTKADDTTSSSHNAKPNVGCSISFSQFEHPSTKIGYVLLKQIEDHSLQDSFWLMKGLSYLLIESPNIMVVDVLEVLCKLMPQTKEAVQLSFKKV